MGQEILYCGVCQNQLRGSDFDKGAAFRIGREAWCKACVPADRAAAARSAPPPEQTPKRGSQRIPVIDNRTPRPRPSTVTVKAGRSGSPGLWAAFIGGAAVIAVAVVLASGSPPAGPPPPSKPPPSLVVEPAPPSPPPLPAGPTLKEQKALDSLKAARAAPSEETYSKALNDALGTPLEPDARRGLEDLRAQRRRVAERAAEKAALDAEVNVRAALDAEDFKRAGELAPARAAEFLGRADLLFRPLLDRTLDALRRGAKEEVEKARARVAAWGVGTFTADLDKALADASKPAPPDAPPSAEAVKAARDAAFERAAGRTFPEAIAELSKVKSTEAGEDVDLLKAAAAAHDDALRALARLPKGKKLAVTVTDFDRNLSRVEGTFVRLHDHHLELQRGKSTGAIQWGHVLPRGFVDLLPAKDRRAVAAACLLEGDEAGALEILKDKAALPARWWDWAADFRRRHTEGPLASLERDVSYKYYEALLRFPNPAARADGAMTCAKIAKDHRDLAWVGRHLALLESRGELAKDFVAGADLLRPGGGFRLETDRDRAYWMSTADGDPSKRGEHFVELEFSTLPDLPYRAWAYIGACCAETAAFAVQGSEIADDAPAVKHGFLTKTHAAHGGKKRPDRWTWVELPLPRYAAPGAKSLRLATNQQGFSVAWIVASATRDKPFADAELKERDKDLPRGPGPAGPTLGMLAWYRADAGPVAEGGRVARWADASGRLRHASQPDPAARPLFVPNGLNNKPSVRFDGERASLSFECPVNGLSAMTVVVLAQASKNVRYDNGLGSALEWRQSGSWGMVYVGPSQTHVSWRFGTAQWGNAPVWNRPNNEAWTAPQLVTLRKDGPREELFVQGALALSHGDKWRPLAHTSDVAVIGGGSDDDRNPLQHWAGDVAEILVYARALPEAERLAVEGYLRLKYGL